MERPQDNDQPDEDEDRYLVDDEAWLLLAKERLQKFDFGGEGEGGEDRGRRRPGRRRSPRGGRRGRLGDRRAKRDDDGAKENQEEERDLLVVVLPLIVEASPSEERLSELLQASASSRAPLLPTSTEEVTLPSAELRVPPVAPSVPGSEELEVEVIPDAAKAFGQEDQTDSQSQSTEVQRSLSSELLALKERAKRLLSGDIPLLEEQESQEEEPAKTPPQTAVQKELISFQDPEASGKATMAVKGEGKKGKKKQVTMAEAGSEGERAEKKEPATAQKSPQPMPAPKTPQINTDQSSSEHLTHRLAPPPPEPWQVDFLFRDPMPDFRPTADIYAYFRRTRRLSPFPYAAPSQGAVARAMTPRPWD